MTYKAHYKKANIGYNNRTQRELPSGLLFQNRIWQTTADENDKWLDTDEAAKYLRITPNALRILVHRARVRVFKLGRRLRFRQSDLLAVLQLKED